MKDIQIVLLVGKGESSRIVYHALKNQFNIVAVIEENKISTWQLLKRRVQRIGWGTVLGQVAFMIYLKGLKKISLPRLNQIKEQYNLLTSPYPNSIFFQVDSINNPCVAEKLAMLKPAVIVVNGTRIINGDILSALNASFINTHVGITPRYRGVHGAYWALAENNAAECGVTIHLVDVGIDTGGILYQTQIQITSRDNFLTYPYLQLAAAIPYLRQAIVDIFTNKHKIIKNNLSSKFYTHPTLFTYIKNYLIKRVK